MTAVGAQVGSAPAIAVRSDPTVDRGPMCVVLHALDRIDAAGGGRFVVWGDSAAHRWLRRWDVGHRVIHAHRTADCRPE
jgi:hypothetical protein